MLFTALGEGALNLRQIVVKFVGVADTRVVAFPSTSALYPPRPVLALTRTVRFSYLS
jgi:hypothetical protein